MKVLLLARIKSINGTATVLSRLADGLISEGHEVYFLKLDSTRSLIEGFSSNVEKLDLKHFLKLRNEFDSIFCFTDEMLWLALFFKRFINKAKIFGVVFHPRQYISSDQGLILGGIYKNFFVKYLSNNLSSLVFMNDACLKSHEEHYGFNFDSSQIIPIATHAQDASVRLDVWPGNLCKIISIGRLVDFKFYHEALINDLVVLRDRGCNFEYHIYGDGPLESHLVDILEANSLNDFVFYHGVLDYSRLAEVVDDCTIFVGQGASLVFAASRARPCLMAIESESNALTYGFCGDEFKGLGVGEKNEKYTAVKIASKIESIILNSDKYETLGKAAYEYSRAFSQEQVARQYLDLARHGSGIGSVFSVLDTIKYLAARCATTIIRILFGVGSHK